MLSNQNGVIDGVFIRIINKKQDFPQKNHQLAYFDLLGNAQRLFSIEVFRISRFKGEFHLFIGENGWFMGASPRWYGLKYRS